MAEDVYVARLAVAAHWAFQIRYITLPTKVHLVKAVVMYGCESREEKTRGRKETEVSRGIKGRIKKRETDPASIKFPKCSPQSRTHKEIQRVE